MTDTLTVGRNAENDSVNESGPNQSVRGEAARESSTEFPLSHTNAPSSAELPELAEVAPFSFVSISSLFKNGVAAGVSFLATLLLIWYLELTVLFPMSPVLPFFGVVSLGLLLLSRHL